MSITTHEQVNVHVERREDDIYIINAQQGSNETVDEWMAHAEDIYSQHETTQETIMILAGLDTTPSPPLAHAMQAAQRLISRHPRLPPGRIAFISHDAATSLFGTLAQINRLRIEVRFFKPEQRDDAIAWLKEAL